MGSSESPAWDSGSIDLDSQQQRADDCGGTLVGLQVQSPIMQMADGGSLAEGSISKTELSRMKT